MIHVGDPRGYDRVPPVEKLLTMVFALVASDRATWLRLDYHPDPPDARMWYCVPPTVHEMVPPPDHLWPDLFRTLLSHARLARADRPGWWQRFRRGVSFPDRPVFGVLPARFGDAVHEFDILFYRGPTGEHIWVETGLPLPPAAVADDFLRRRLYRFET